MTTIQSQIVSSVLQANGSYNVIERHTASDGRIFDVAYNAPAGMDQQAVLSARAERISSSLQAQAAIQAEALNYVLPLTHLQFISRFTTAERIAIRAARETDQIIDDFFDLLSMANDVVPAHPSTQAGLGYLVSVGLLTAERAAEIGA